MKLFLFPAISYYDAYCSYCDDIRRGTFLRDLVWTYGLNTKSMILYVRYSSDDGIILIVFLLYLLEPEIMIPRSLSIGCSLRESIGKWSIRVVEKIHVSIMQYQFQHDRLEKISTDRFLWQIMTRIFQVSIYLCDNREASFFYFKPNNFRWTI